MSRSIPLAALALIALSQGGCSAAIDEDSFPGAELAPMGTAGGVCLPSGGCDRGLECRSGLCVAVAGGDEGEGEGEGIGEGEGQGVGEGEGEGEGEGDPCAPGGSGEGCVCVLGDFRACGSLVGRCRPGIQICTDEGWSACEDGVQPAPEVCNLVDDDCDGDVDEEFDGLGEPCGQDEGQCELGALACVEGVLTCEGGVGPAPEECNGLDDDCNGQPDDPGDRSRPWKTPYLVDHAEVMRSAAGDLDGDGLPELVALANHGGDPTCVFRGLAEGSWAPCDEVYENVCFGCGRDAAVEFAPIDGDEFPDLLLTHSTDGTSLFANDGEGGLRPRMDAGAGGFYPLLCDVNGDGALDVLFRDPKVLFGNGDGTFGPAQALGISMDMGRSVVCADVDGDPHVDLVGTGQGCAGLQVARGRGDGFFHATQCTAPLAGLSGPNSVAVGHIDDDGRLDAVVGFRDPDAFAVFMGNGNGTFRARDGVDAGDRDPLYLSLRDVDGDGFQDILSVSDSISPLTFHRGRGGGRFDPGVGYGPWKTPSRWVRSQDLVGDASEDLLIVGASMIQIVPILEDGEIHADRRLYVGANVGSPVVADVDGDGHPDLLAAHRDGQMIRVFLLAGDLGRKERVRSLETPAEPTDQAVMDVNLDQVADVLDLSRVGGSLGVRLGIDEDGVWSPGDRAAIAVGRSPVELLVTDIDGDDLPDVAVLLREDAAVAVLLHDGRSGFAEPVLYDVGGRPVSWAAGDLNRDGRVDLITVDSDDGRLSVLLGGADGVFEAARTINPDCAGPSGVAVGDVTGDEWPDLAIACTADGAVIVLPGIEEGGQLFGPAQFPYVATGGRPTIVRLSDVDKDGRLDMLVALDSNKVALLYGADPSECPDGGCVRFEDEVQVAYPYALTGLEVADLDGDGADELITTLGSVVSVYRGQRIACPAVGEGEGEGEADP